MLTQFEGLENHHMHLGELEDGQSGVGSPMVESLHHICSDIVYVLRLIN